MGVKGLLDYVLMTKRMVDTFKDVHMLRGVAAGMSDHSLVEAKVVVAKEQGNKAVGCRMEVVKVGKKKKKKKTGVPGQVERDIRQGEREGSWRVRGGMGLNERKFCEACKQCAWKEVCWTLKQIK